MHACHVLHRCLWHTFALQAAKLGDLFAQKQCAANVVMVQQRVENATCEIRTFVVNGEPKHFLYTRFLKPNAEGACLTCTPFNARCRCYPLYRFAVAAVVWEVPNCTFFHGSFT
jgi:hypothetical protein